MHTLLYRPALSQMPGQEEEKACRDVTPDYPETEMGGGGRQTIQLGLMLRRGSSSGVQFFCAHTNKEEKVSQGESEAGSVPTLKCQSMMEGP